jgi:hypothetical protein
MERSLHQKLKNFRRSSVQLELSRPPPDLGYSAWVTLLLTENMVAWSDEEVCNEANIDKLSNDVRSELAERYIDHIEGLR